MSVVAVDQGTTATKALLIEDDGHFAPPRRASGTSRSCRAPAGSSTTPAELLANVREAIALGVAAGATSVALDNQGETVVAWDKSDGTPLCNAIVWQDQRTQDAVDRLRSDGHEAEVTARSGLPLDAYFSASKLRWILDNVPRRERARAQRPPRPWHERQLLHSPAHRPLRHRCHDGRTHLADEPRHLRVGRAARRTVRRAARPAAGDRRMRPAGGRAVGRQSHRHARRRDRRSGGIALWPWLPQARATSRRPSGPARSR